MQSVLRRIFRPKPKPKVEAKIATYVPRANLALQVVGFRKVGKHTVCVMKNCKTGKEVLLTESLLKELFCFKHED